MANNGRVGIPHQCEGGKKGYLRGYCPCLRVMPTGKAMPIGPLISIKYGALMKSKGGCGIAKGYFSGSIKRRFQRFDSIGETEWLQVRGFWMYRRFFYLGEHAGIGIIRLKGEANDPIVTDRHPSFFR